MNKINEILGRGGHKSSLVLLFLVYLRKGKKNEKYKTNN